MEADAETDMEENAALIEEGVNAMEENVDAEAKGSEDPQSFQCVHGRKCSFNGRRR